VYYNSYSYTRIRIRSFADSYRKVRGTPKSTRCNTLGGTVRSIAVRSAVQYAEFGVRIRTLRTTATYNTLEWTMEICVFTDYRGVSNLKQESSQLHQGSRGAVSILGVSRNDLRLRVYFVPRVVCILLIVPMEYLFIVPGLAVASNICTLYCSTL
jgi:hypothetical protein